MRNGEAIRKQALQANKEESYFTRALDTEKPRVLRHDEPRNNLKTNADTDTGRRYVQATLRKQRMLQKIRAVDSRESLTAGHQQRREKVLAIQIT